MIVISRQISELILKKKEMINILLVKKKVLCHFIFNKYKNIYHYSVIFKFFQKKGEMRIA